MSTKIIPHISCRNAADAVEFYKKAFGAETAMVMNTEDGRIMHATLTIDGATLYVVDEFPEFGGKSPQSLGGSPVMIALQVADCDAVFGRAVEAGCTITMPLEDMFWGDRWGLLTDPYGHQWSVATPKREMSIEELREATRNATCGQA